MHHCVGTYASEVKCGGIYVYSIRRDGERQATLALARNGSSASLIQIRGHCNAQPSKAIISTAQRWLRAQTPLPPQDPPRQNHEADKRAKYETAPFVVRVEREQEAWLVTCRDHGWLHSDRLTAIEDANFIARGFGAAVVSS